MTQTKQTSRFKILFLRALEKLKNIADNNANCDPEINGEYWFLRFLSQTYKGHKFTCFDVGANKGEYTRKVLEIFNNKDLQIYSFEPLKECIKKLEMRYKDSTNVKVIPKGLSSIEGKKKIFFNDPQGELSSLYERNLSIFSSKLDQSEEITLSRGDLEMKKLAVSKINLLKIDVEGHELEVLKGFGTNLTCDTVDFIQFEYNNTNIDAHTTLFDFYVFLEKKGFVLHKLMPNKIEKRNYYYFMENFTYANYIAISKKILFK